MRLFRKASRTNRDELNLRGAGEFFASEASKLERRD